MRDLSVQMKMEIHSFQCQFCEEVFSSSIQMAQHWQNRHHDDQPQSVVLPEAPIYQILQPEGQAAATFLDTATSSQGFKEQVLVPSSCSDGAGDLTCHTCSQEFASRDDLQRHVAVHAAAKSSEDNLEETPLKRKPAVSGKAFCCDVCGKTYSTASNLYKHGRTHMGVLYQCRFCLKQFKYRESKKKHEKRYCSKRGGQMNRQEQHHCAYCSETFPTRLRLGIHLRSHPLEKPHKCDQCERTFSHRNGLERHMSTHSSTRNHLCPQCGQAFAYQQSLNAHMKTHNSQKRFQCAVCSKAFSHKQTLLEHELLHRGKRKYQCRHCPKRFRQRSTLWGHEQIHTREKTHECTACGEQFGTWKGLQGHKKKHWVESGKINPSGEVDVEMRKEKWFECQECGDTFLQKAVLQTHMRRHTGETPYVCPVCGRRFRHLASQRRHILAHSRENKYECTVCAQSFTKKASLKLHLEKKHSPMDQSEGGMCPGMSSSSVSKESSCPVEAGQEHEDIQSDRSHETSSKSNVHCFIEKENSNIDPVDGIKVLIDQVGEGEDLGSSQFSRDHAIPFEGGGRTDQTIDCVGASFPQNDDLNQENAMIVSFQDMCGVPINEECVQTMNILDHVIQLAQISQSDLQEDHSDVDHDDDQGDIEPLDVQEECVVAGESSPLGMMKQFICEVCGKLYHLNSSLLRHKKTHTARKPHQCHLCDRSYSRKPLLKEHIQFAHGDHFKPHSCRYCKKAFPSAKRLDLHMRVHTQDKPFKCAICLKAFADRSNLRCHERIHRRPKPRKCPECPQTFTQKPALKRHLARHRQEKLFPCPHCPKSFSLRADLQSHSAIHVAATEPNCSLCGLTYPRQVTFQRHQALSRKSARKCRVCGVSCPNECLRRQHEMQEHKFLIVDSGFACGECETRFTSRPKAIAHIQKCCR